MNDKQCKGIVRNTNVRCQNKPRDINGFCHQHHDQSCEYERSHPVLVYEIQKGSISYWIKDNFNNKIPYGGHLIYSSQQ